MESNKVLHTSVYFTRKDITELTEIVSQLTGDNIDLLAKLMDLEATYPDFYKWYLFKVLPDLRHRPNARKILLTISEIRDGSNIVKRLTGLAIIKKRIRERKICTFRVFPEYRHQGIGTLLFQYCMTFLETQKPLISISDKALNAFEPFIEKYEWTLCEVLPDYYKKGITEYVFNGFLKKN